MIVLGLESSCDETAAAVVENGTRVHASIVASQNDIHAEYAGVVPELASRAHVERVLPVVRQALGEAGLGLGMVDAIAVGHRPGLIGCLLVGVAAAKALAWSLDKPLIGVDHVHAHLYAGELGQPAADAASLFPALGLVVSGGHTSVYEVTSWTSLRRLGATIDDAMGEAYDKAAAILGLPFPGGPNLDRLAREHAGGERIALPVSRLGHDSLDFSFSGLKTALLYAVKGVPGERVPQTPPALDDARRRVLAASFQHAACEAVRLKLTRAIEQSASRGMRFRRLLVGGGVTANTRLREVLGEVAAAHALTMRLPALDVCVDNAAMIAGLGCELLRAGERSDLSLLAVPTTSA
ncbi:MAG: tRNA (adenosine(37)-N6)-threonylcarbamoyltransferase complex transferase subunit TsaD [Tepidisphaera sp.]|nr:tRNA (adenosine(37)-N6)-threonylcarbamoyltransferase complex transferase subunit TsaD [Tepidisphaera sp.]